MGLGRLLFRLLRLAFRDCSRLLSCHVGHLDAGIEYYGLEDLISPLELAWDDDWDLVGPVAKL